MKRNNTPLITIKTVPYIDKSKAINIFVQIALKQINSMVEQNISSQKSNINK